MHQQIATTVLANTQTLVAFVEALERLLVVQTIRLVTTMLLLTVIMVLANTRTLVVFVGGLEQLPDVPIIQLVTTILEGAGYCRCNWPPAKPFFFKNTCNLRDCGWSKPR